MVLMHPKCQFLVVTLLSELTAKTLPCLTQEKRRLVIDNAFHFLLTVGALIQAVNLLKVKA